MEYDENLFKDNLPKYHHLEKIRERLWAEDGKSRVSIMVGSGFSLNATKLDDSLESMSTWLGVKNRILEGLGLDKLSNVENVLDISENYASEYGRESLDNLIKQTVPDQNYEPGEIHKSLLKLPWADVFTTNYDTLLERTLPHIVERNYQVIYDVRDIPSSSSPRIVKLHGSFPSNRPFIFTRSDYESYSKDFAPLVNMVQQSIMETTFVLIGFSGDDPNFESWTKWVNMNLGEHMPKIYMLAHGEQERESFLKQRGITLIDFKEVYSEKNNSNVYQLMFNDVFQFLTFKEKKDERDWPYKNYLNQGKINNLLERFTYNRVTYPGWLVMPDIIKKSNIVSVQLACKELIDLVVNTEKEMSLRITALSELLWVYDIFQIPMDYNIQLKMMKLIDESINREGFDRTALEGIILRLLKEARMDYKENDFNKYLNLLENIDLNDNNKNQFIFEKILMRTAKFENEDVKMMLDEWLLTNKDIEWMVKRAVIFSRIGEKEKAIKIFEDNLTRVRKVIAINKNNLRLLSLEGIILFNLIQLNRNTLQSSKERLLVLESRLSNPFKELDFMFSRIKPYKEESGIFKSKSFDPNRISQTSKFNNVINMELVDSYSLMNLYDEFGLDFSRQKGGKDAITVAIKNLEELYTFYSWVLYLRIGDIKKIDLYFSRNAIYKAETSTISLFAEIIMSGVKSRQNIALKLELLSRLYFGLEIEHKMRVDKLVLELFSDKLFHLDNYSHTKKMFEHLFRRILFDKSKEEKESFLGEIYKLPIIGDPQGDLSGITVDELNFFDPSFEFKFIDHLNLRIDSGDVDKLLGNLKKEKSFIRDATLKRLTFLLDTGNLCEEYSAKFNSLLSLIIRIEKKNYSNVLLESYLVLKTNNYELQEEYSLSLIQEEFPRSFNGKQGSISIGHGLENLLKNLKNILPGFNYSDNCFLNLNNDIYITLLKKFFIWWDDQEEWLLEKDTNDFFGTNDDLLHMTIFLKNSFLPNIPLECLTKSDLTKFKEIVTKISNEKFDLALLLFPTLLKIGVVDQKSLVKVNEGLVGSDLEIFKSSLVASFDLVVLESKNKIVADLTEIKVIVLNLFIYRKEITLIETTRFLSEVIKYAPSYFNETEYVSIIKSLNLILRDIKDNNCNKNSSVDDENELLSELANLSGQIYVNGRFILRETLKLWKKFVSEHRLPEVRKSSHLFLGI